MREHNRAFGNAPARIATDTLNGTILGLDEDLGNQQ
jgi:hypothetical protein